MNSDCTSGICDPTTKTCENVDLSGGGCHCNAGGSPLGALVLAFVVGAVVLRRRRAVTLAALIVAFATATARAQGFDATLYQPATSTSAYFSQDGAFVLPLRQLDLAAGFDYANDPLVAHVTGSPDSNGIMGTNVIANRLAFHLTAGYGITRDFELGVAVPFVLAQNGDLSAIDLTHKLRTTTFGDIRAFGKYRLLQRDIFELAAALDVTVPTGSADDFTGGRTVSARPRLVFGVRRDRWSAAINAGVRLRGKTMVVDDVVGNEFTTGVGAAYELVPGRLSAIGEAFLAAGLDHGAHSVPAEALVGARGVVRGPLVAQLAVGEGLGQGYATPAFEAIASMMLVTDFAKKHPPRRAEPPKDTDGDGLTDDVDQCPLEPEDKDGYQDADGCPDPDNDGDGIPDAQDKCPNEAEDLDGFEDADGCPDRDNDKDGIVDAQDQCPNEPEDFDGFQDADGCPDPDNDRDGIPDAVDKCPNEPETKNGYQDADGCPDTIPDKVKKFTGVIQGINFKLGSAELQRSSSKVLDAAVKVMNEFPDIRFEIQGHTDDQPIRAGGKFKDNNELSQARADSVRSYLVAMGIAPDRLTAIGYGPREPLEDPSGLKGAKLTAARAKNRRVQFELVMAPP
jgi:outer membrane protein OmpA-like peptidoglycan-associated protein